MNDPKPTDPRAHAGRNGRALLTAAVAAAVLPLATFATEQVDYTPDYTKLLQDHSEHHAVHDSALVREVHDATKRYTHIREALVVDNNNPYLKQPQWVVGTPCVSGPETGAMGIHIVNPGRTTTGSIDPKAPAALIYEPQPDGKLVLVGLEYIHDAAAWAHINGKGSVPSLDGHLLNFVGEPNRYGLPAFYEIHVWAFEGNPMGAFADWNTHVTCEKQPLKFTVKP